MMPFVEDRRADITITNFHAMDFPEHLHRHMELLYLEEGSLEILLDGSSHTMHPGDLAVIFPNMIHGYRQADVPSRGRMMIFPPEIAGDYAKKLLEKESTVPFLSEAQLHTDILYAINGLYFESAGEHQQNVLKAYIQLLLSRALPCLTLTKKETKDRSELLYRMLDYLSSHYAEPLSLAQVAAALSVSPFYLSHMIAQKLHTNFRTYINILRVSQARNMLISTSKTVTQICFECGFDNLRTFDRVFFDQCSLTPLQYRRANQ